MSEEQPQAFQVGGVVQLVSGGPPLSVKAVRGDVVDVVWFEPGRAGAPATICEATIPKCVLVRVERAYRQPAPAVVAAG